LIRDAEMTGAKLFEAATSITDALPSMGEAAREFAKPGAARRAADILEEVARV
jgi:UDP-N-acetylglucosamine:LPS N-acetylglucosamine transferase